MNTTTTNNASTPVTEPLTSEEAQAIIKQQKATAAADDEGKKAKSKREQREENRLKAIADAESKGALTFGALPPTFGLSTLVTLPAREFTTAKEGQKVKPFTLLIHGITKKGALKGWEIPVNVAEDNDIKQALGASFTVLKFGILNGSIQLPPVVDIAFMIGNEIVSTSQGTFTHLKKSKLVAGKKKDETPEAAKTRFNQTFRTGCGLMVQNFVATLRNRIRTEPELLAVIGGELANVL